MKGEDYFVVQKKRGLRKYCTSSMSLKLNYVMSLPLRSRICKCSFLQSPFDLCVIIRIAIKNVLCEKYDTICP